jgi:ActR/RegA family two-component response regulator
LTFVINRASFCTWLAAKLRDILDADAGQGGSCWLRMRSLVWILAVEQLENLGFKVETAGSATEALNKIRLANGGLAAAIVDLGLRQGDVLVAKVRAIYPPLPIVIASGYGGEALKARFKGDEHIAFLAKPYAANHLETALASLRVRGK